MDYLYVVNFNLTLLYVGSDGALTSNAPLLPKGHWDERAKQFQLK